jgi:O-antigen ligase
MNQKVPRFAQDSQAGAPCNRWFDIQVDLGNERDTVPHSIWVAAAMVGLLSVGIIAFPARAAMVTLVAVVTIVLPWAIYCVRRQVSRILIVLILIEAATASNVVAAAQSDIGALIRGPVEFLFCLPIFLSVWRSKLIRQGGFRDYKIYLICALASAIYSLAPEITLVRGLTAILPFIALCAIAEQVHSGDDARRVLGVLLAGCGIVVAVNFLALVLVPGGSSWHPDPDTGMLRFNGIFTEPNEIGSLAMATLGAGFGFWPIAKGWKRALCACAMIGSTVLAALADSRSPLAAIAIGLALYLVWRYRLRGAIGIVALFAIVHTVFVSVPGMRAYVDRGDVASFTGREVAWDFAIRSIKEHPLIGYGYDVEGQILQSKYFAGWDEVWSEGYHTSLHNGYLARAVGLGIPGLLFWLFFIARPTLKAFVPDQDPWSLRSIVWLSMLPPLIMNFTESIPDLGSFAGVEMALVWTLLERQRLLNQAKDCHCATVAEKCKSNLVCALQA